ncbi:MAG: lipid-A-disaccharide synthase [Succinivibrio sp.]|nr:lipid-A-disaccharide synthase [Succinivibrio sp.]
MTAEQHNPHLYALVAGELSGDTLGAGLMLAILRHDPEAQFIGIGGPKMIACGLHSSFKIEQLAVMGISEVLAQLVPILKIRKQITRIIRDAKPCVFVGIDAPDFNLTIERKLRAEGIPTVHYVSPSVWAWRQGRMKKIRASCDHMLSLLKFEKDFYDEQGMPCTYVGHTLANSIPLEIDENLSRERLDLMRTSVEPVTDKVLGILPGSRANVIARMLPIYTSTARIIKKQMPKICFISTVPTRELAEQVKDIWLENAPDLSLTIYVGSPHEVISSCSAVLLTSGTIALETMLLKRPFAVAYKVSALTAAICKRMLKVNIFSLPNLIAHRRVVNEFIQDQCTPEALAEEMIKLLTSDNLLMKKEFYNLHNSMRCNSDELAAQAVLKVIAEHGSRPREAAAGKRSEPVVKTEPKSLPSSEKLNFKNDIEPEMTLPTNAELIGKSSKTEPKF